MGRGRLPERALLNAVAHICPQRRLACGDTFTFFWETLKFFTLTMLLLAHCTKATAFSMRGCLGGESVIAKPLSEEIQEKVESAPDGTSASLPGDRMRAPRGGRGGAEGGKVAYMITKAHIAIS